MSSELQELEALLEELETKQLSNDELRRTAREFISKARRLVEGKSDLDRELTGEEIVTVARGIGWILSNSGVKKTQLRKFLDMVNRVKAHYDPNDAAALRYRMAYAVSRERGLRPFMDVVEPGLKRAKDKEDFKRLARLVEAVVAYHAFYGGRD